MTTRNGGFRVLLAAAGLLLVGTTETGEAAEASQPQVTVEAHRATLQRRVQQFVAQITAGPSDTSLELWRLPVCPLVAGLPAEQGETVLVRLSQIAMKARVPLAPKHCDPNLVVVVTPDPPGLIEAWRKRSHGDIFNGASGMTVRGFVETSRPVRVWYNDAMGDQKGTPMSSVTPAAVTFSSDDPFPSAPVNSNAEDTRLMLNAVKNLTSVILVVDAQSIEHMTVGQVADYVGMIGLGKLHSGTPPTDAPTILNLFTGGPQGRPAGLTDGTKLFCTRSITRARTHARSAPQSRAVS